MTDPDNGETDQDPTEAAYAEAHAGSALPAVDFTTFLVSLSHSAVLHLGDTPDPSTGKRELNLPMARQTIDLISLIREKTRGNLSGAEERLMEQVLYDLRLRYVEVANSK